MVEAGGAANRTRAHRRICQDIVMQDLANLLDGEPRPPPGDERDKRLGSESQPAAGEWTLNRGLDADKQECHQMQVQGRLRKHNNLTMPRVEHLLCSYLNSSADTHVRDVTECQRNVQFPIGILRHTIFPIYV